MILFVMGVAGAGKSTVGEALAQRMGWDFLDADDLHPDANKQKMRAGIPLSDADRAPWLRSVAEHVRTFIHSNKDAVVACSLLKQQYRDEVCAAETSLVYLRLSRELAEVRTESRRHAFMPPTLVASQYADLEEPIDALVIDAAMPVEQIVARIISGLCLRPQS